MSSALLRSGPAPPRARTACSAGGRRDSHRLFDPGRPTLEDTINRAWGDLVDTGTAKCPVCGGELHVSGCTSCGSQLS